MWRRTNNHKTVINSQNTKTKLPLISFGEKEVHEVYNKISGQKITNQHEMAREVAGIDTVMFMLCTSRNLSTFVKIQHLK